MNKKVQRRQARVRHARRVEILEAGRQWSLDAAPEPRPDSPEAAPGPDGEGKVGPTRRDGDLR